MFTGYRPSPAILFPSMGSIVTHEFPPRNHLPQYVCIPGQPNSVAGTGYLPSSFAPFSLGSDPASGSFTVKDLKLPGDVDDARFVRRRKILSAVNEHFKLKEKGDSLDAVDSFYSRAYNMVSSQAAREAFDISKEPGKLRDEYGRNSVQRRYQKVIEETPSPALDQDLRSSMGKSAVALAKTAGYINAGTVEFLLDSDTGRYYFLEMNARIQVEHPVTEETLRLDLVEWQIRIAFGAPITLSQEDIRPSGHALECRIYAEDTYSDFGPATGQLISWRPPHGVGLRLDSGVAEGLEVTPYYDSMLAKLVSWASTNALSPTVRNTQVPMPVSFKRRWRIASSSCRAKARGQKDAPASYISSGLSGGIASGPRMVK